jgi:hypothetical protein
MEFRDLTDNVVDLVRHVSDAEWTDWTLRFTLFFQGEDRGSNPVVRSERPVGCPCGLANVTPLTSPKEKILSQSRYPGGDRVGGMALNLQ